MESTKKYEYILEQSEIMEFCLHALAESAKRKKWTWFRLMLILALEWLILPRAAVWIAVLLVAVMLVSVVVNWIQIRKSIAQNQWTVWIENGILKVIRGGSSEVPCSSIQLVRTTRRLLMLGYLQTAQRPAWFIVPLRVFADRQEQERFLDRIRNPQTAGDSSACVESGEEGLCFTYTIDDGRWIQLQKGALGVITSGTIGMKERIRIVLIWSLFEVFVMLSCIYLVAGHLSWQFVLFGLCVAALLTVRTFLRDPEKALRKQIRAQAVRDRECGVWQVLLSEAGVCTKLPDGTRNDYAWETLAHLVETEQAFYIFHRDRKHYVTIAKESFQDWNQVSALHELCARKGIKDIQGRRMHYLPDWAFALMAVLFVMVSVAFMFISIFRNQMQETREQLREASQGIYRQKESESETEPAGYSDQKTGETSWQKESETEPTDYPDQKPRGISWQDDFDPADYPDYVPLDEQVEVLESFGFEVPEEVLESVRDSVTEYGLRVPIEGYPYTWLLTSLGAPQYNEDWTAIEEYSRDVFWFDFEGWDYIDVLNGMLALAEDGSLDTVTNISEDDSKVDWERGKGTITVSLEWEGQTYHWDMRVYYDWLDSDVLGILNALLTEQKSQKLFYAAGDNGQGAIIFFCTAEWAENFMKATGLELTYCTTWSTEQMKNAQ